MLIFLKNALQYLIHYLQSRGISIEGLTSSFVASLQSNFTSTVSTIFRSDINTVMCSDVL